MKERMGQDILGGSEEPLEQIITFNMTKNEMFKISDNLKILNRKLKVSYRVNNNRENITNDNEIINSSKIFVLPGPRLNFDDAEIDVLQQLLDRGKSLLILANEGGETSLNTNINQFLEQFGIVLNSDCVVRTQYCKYFLPKECYLNDSSSNTIFGYAETGVKSWCYVYPFGSTITIAKPSVTALASGNECFPANRPLCAVYMNRNTNGRLVVLGSGQMLTDKYIDLEQNDKFCEKLFQFLTEDMNLINDIDVDEFDIWDYHMAPDIPMIAEKPQLGLVDSANTILTDYTKLFNTELYSLNTDFVPEIIQVYEETNVKHSPLTLIVPRFEEAIPKLQLAVFPPLFCELKPPGLELFDLEEEFSNEDSQLAQLTNKFISNDKNVETKTDLEQFIMGATNILGVGQQDYTPARQVYECALIISNFKMSNNEESSNLLNLDHLNNDYDVDMKELNDTKNWLNENRQTSESNIAVPEDDSDLDSFVNSD